MTLLPLPRIGLMAEQPQPIDGFLAGEAFLTEAMAEREADDGVRFTRRC